MTLSFGCPQTALLFSGVRVPRFVNIKTVAMRKLAMLHRAASLGDLRAPPNNRLEALAGDRQGQWSIRISAQWRLRFCWTGNNAIDLEIVDCH